MSSNPIILNCFPVKLLPLNYELPFLTYDSWETSTKKLKAGFGDYAWYRIKENDGRIRALLLSGPERPNNLDVIDVDASVLPDFGKALIARSLSRHFTGRGLTVFREKTDTTVLRTTPEFSRQFIDIYCGVTFQARHPFIESPDDFAMSVQWEVRTTFNRSLAEPQLTSMAQGMPVIYKPETRENLSDDLKQFVHRYMGHVHEIRADAKAVVDCKDHVHRTIPLTDLFLEASPAVIREYERQSSPRQSSRSLWYKIQELSFVLNSHGRRNMSVLKDRLQAIRTFLGGSSKEQLIVPVATFQEGSISIGLNPMRVEVE
jgi:hypothetical protein